LEILEEDWGVFSGCNDAQGLKKTALTTTMMLPGFFAALRGEEMVCIDIRSTRHHWQEATCYKDEEHVPLMLAGRFKKETGEKLFSQPLLPVSASGVKIAVWFHRAPKLGIESGPMFRIVAKGTGQFKKASVGDLDRLLHNILLRLQKRYPNIIKSDCFEGP
jgi:hypothetical protein